MSRRNDSRREATPQPRQQSRIHRNEHAELTTVLSHVFDVSRPCHFEPLTRHHPRRYIRGSMFLRRRRATGESRFKGPDIPECVPPCPAGRHRVSTRWNMCIRTFSVLVFSNLFVLALANFNWFLPHFESFCRLEPRQPTARPGTAQPPSRPSHSTSRSQIDSQASLSGSGWRRLVREV
jgi:hypothetical protein